MPGEGGPLDRGAVGPGEDIPARLPARARRFALLALPVAVLFQGAQALGGQGDAPFRALGLGRQRDKAAAVGALEDAADAGGSAGQVEVFPAQAEELALAESGPGAVITFGRAPQSCPSPFLKSRTVLRILRIVVLGTSSGTPWAPT